MTKCHTQQDRNTHICVAFLQSYGQTTWGEGGTGLHFYTHSKLGAELLDSLSSQQVRLGICPGRRKTSTLSRTSSHLCHFFLRLFLVLPPQVTTTFCEFSLPRIILGIRLLDPCRITFESPSHVPHVSSVLPSWRVTFHFRNNVEEQSLGLESRHVTRSRGSPSSDECCGRMLRTGCPVSVVN